MREAVTRLSVTGSFLDSMGELDPLDAKRVAAFVEKLISSPEAAGLRPEMVHDAQDRSARSFKVTHDLRAIARVDGDETALLFVARHDAAYVWARTHCVVCLTETRELRLVEHGGPHTGRALRSWRCDDSGELCAVLDSRGIPHAVS